MKEGVLTEFVRMSRADGRHNGVRERSGPPWLRLLNRVRNASLALAFARRLRSVLRETLQQPAGGGLEILQAVGRGWQLCIGDKQYRNGEARVRRRQRRAG